MRLDYLKKTAKKQTGITNEEFDAEVKEYKFPNAKAEVDDETVEIVLERCALTVEERNRVAIAHPALLTESIELKNQFAAFQAMVARSFAENNEIVRKGFVAASNEIKSLRDRMNLVESRLEGMKVLLDDQSLTLEKFRSEIESLLVEAKPQTDEQIVPGKWVHPKFVALGLESMFEE